MVFNIFSFISSSSSEELPLSSFTTIHGIAANISSTSSLKKVIPHPMKAKIMQLSLLTSKLELIAPKYDRPGYKKANGFRSIIKVINKFVPTLVATFTQLDSSENVQWLTDASKESNLPSSCFTSIDSVLVILIELCDQAIDCHNNWSLVQDPKEKFIWLNRVYRYTYDRLSTHFEQYWAHHPMFWYDSSIRRFISATLMLLTFVIKPSSTLYTLVSKKERGARLASFVWRGDPFHLSTLVNLLDNPLMMGVNKMVLKYHGITVKHLSVPRQKDWLIPYDGGPVMRNKGQYYGSDDLSSETVKIRMYQMNNVKPSGKVIVHIQGGGFMVDAHSVHSNSYLKSWLPQLNGAIVLNVDYSVSVRYPVALQEIVDTLFWLTNPKNANEIATTLQMIPTSMVLLGDSCGAYLALASCAVLRDIKDIAPDQISIFPHSMVYLSPVMAPVNLNYPPSLLLSILDPLLCPTLNLQILSLYSAGITLDSECHSLLDPSSTSSLQKETGYNKESFWFGLSRCLFNTEPNWFDCDPVIFEKRLIKLTDKLFNPYISILTSYDLTRLTSEVKSVHLITSDLDVQMDSAFEFERIWKGKITIDVVDDLPHGFYGFSTVSEAAKTALQLCLDRLKQAIES